MDNRLDLNDHGIMEERQNNYYFVIAYYKTQDGTAYHGDVETGQKIML